MAVRDILTPDEVRQRLRYDRLTGLLYWRARAPSGFAHGLHGPQHQANAWNAKYAGKEAFTARNVGGYRVGAINGSTMVAHRVAWAIVHGTWPKHHIDHINGDTGDNRMCNLRDVLNLENHHNAAMSKNNASGVNGVCWCKQQRQWRAMIRVNGRNICLGRYDTIEAAAEARKVGNARYGFSERHGSPTRDTSPLGPMRYERNRPS